MRKNFTREELRRRRNIASGVAWFILVIVLACAANVAANAWTGGAPGSFCEEVQA